MNTFRCTFMDEGSRIFLHLTNTTPATLRSVEILTVFLKDDSTPGGPSHAHIRFEPVGTIRPNEDVVVPHKTWIDGKPVSEDADQLRRLKPAADKLKPYVFDISWQDPAGKTRFQRIPVGH